jgi:thimet oligopeptidase
MAELLAAKRKEFPSAEAVNSEDVSYYQRLVRDGKYAYDVQEARRFLPYTAVKDAVFKTTAKLFGLEFRRVAKAQAWHSSVEVYEVVDRGRAVGRFYLDMHPRNSKYQSFAAGMVRPATAGSGSPEVLLIGNFSDPTAGPALLDPDQAVVFFHEFGHVMHLLLSGSRQRWYGALRPESDFMEAPSKFLEEWLQSPEVLVSFTRHYQTGERMPLTLAQKVIHAQRFGKAWLAQQTLAISWAFLDMQDDSEPATDIAAIWRTQFARLNMPYQSEAHMEQRLSHLGSPIYAAAYTTYLWSQVIAKDLFTRFDRANLLDAGPAREYRTRILEMGGSQPAAKLVEHFLGRPFNQQAFQRWLQE